MSHKKDWNYIFNCVKRLPDETQKSWLNKISKKTGETYYGLRSAIFVYGQEIGMQEKTSVNDVKPDLTDFKHFSSPDWEFPDGRIEVKPQHNIEGKVMLAMMDIHLPFHDKQSLLTAIEEGKRRNADVVLLNGDIIDCVSLSRFNKSNYDRSFKDELDLARGFLKWIREQFPKAQIIYKEGNHEKRFEDYVRRNADALDNIEDIQLNTLLRLETFGITHIEHTQIMNFGKLNIIHGHEYFGGGVINVARGYLIKAFDNIMLGHRHTSQDYTFKKVNQDLVGAWGVGCLCKLMPAYMSLNQWNHGFCIVEKQPDGTFVIENNKIINGKIF